jgi:hypothetical protein
MYQRMCVPPGFSGVIDKRSVAGIAVTNMLPVA